MCANVKYAANEMLFLLVFLLADVMVIHLNVTDKSVLKQVLYKSVSIMVMVFSDTFNNVHLFSWRWSVCTKPWKWAVMYIYMLKSMDVATVSTIFL
jgi:hypothetical protein